MTDDYGYINARIRAMKSFLLREEAYLEALRQRSLQEFSFFISSLPAYSNEMRQLPAGFSAGSVCDEALKLNMCRAFKKIINFCDGEPKKLISVLLAPWDIYNLKTVIRGILSRRDRREVVQALVPAGRLDIEFLSRIAGSGDLKALSDNLTAFGADWLFKEVRPLLSSYKADTPLEVLDNNLTRTYFRKAVEYLSGDDFNAGMVLEYLKQQIDFLNCFLVLTRPDDGGLEFIKGGNLSGPFLQELAQVDFKEAVLERFRESCYPWLADEGLELYKRTRKLASLERLFKRKLFFFCSNLYARGGALSIGVPLVFINFKEMEIRNLRLIAQGIAFGMPRDLMKEELIYA